MLQSGDKPVDLEFSMDKACRKDVSWPYHGHIRAISHKTERFVASNIAFLPFSLSLQSVEDTPRVDRGLKAW